MSAAELLFFITAFFCECHKIITSSQKHVRSHSCNPPFLYIATMPEPRITPQDQLRIEQTLVKPAAAIWGVKLLKFLKLEKLLKLGDKEG